MKETNQLLVAVVARLTEFIPALAYNLKEQDSTQLEDD